MALRYAAADTRTMRRHLFAIAAVASALLWVAIAAVCAVAAAFSPILSMRDYPLVTTADGRGGTAALSDDGWLTLTYLHPAPPPQPAGQTREDAQPPLSRRRGPGEEADAPRAGSGHGVRPVSAVGLGLGPLRVAAAPGHPAPPRLVARDPPRPPPRASGRVRVLRLRPPRLARPLPRVRGHTAAA